MCFSVEYSFSCDKSQESQAQQIRQREWESKSGETRKVAGYMMNTGIVLVIAGFAACIATIVASRMGVDLFTRKALVISSFSLIGSFIPCTLVSIAISSYTEHKVKRAILEGVSDYLVDSHDIIQRELFEIDRKFVLEGAPDGTNPCLAGLMDKFAKS